MNTHLFHHLMNKYPESSLWNIVSSVLTDIVGSKSEYLHIIITETLQLLVEGRLENSFEEIKSLSNTWTTTPVEKDGVCQLSLSLSLSLSLFLSLSTVCHI